MKLRSGKIVYYYGNEKYNRKELQLRSQLEYIVAEYGPVVHPDQWANYAMDMAWIIYNYNNVLKNSPRFTKMKDIISSKLNKVQDFLMNGNFIFSEDYSYDWNEDQISEILSGARTMLLADRPMWRFLNHSKFWLKNKSYILDIA
uniref:Uncharacterized protein n=1 Tax=viral metagenome TaxID=1070528 RepID=A0A6C0JCV6_9ZZZZ